MRPNVKVTTTCLKYFAKVRKKENRFEHRCTVVKNPEGGPLGVGQILLRGHLGLSENLGAPLFSCFYDQTFQTLTPHPPPPRVYLWI